MMRSAEFVLVDVSNTFTKVVLASRDRLLTKPVRIPTADLSRKSLRAAFPAARHAVVASVVPKWKPILEAVLPGPICWVGPKAKLGIGIDYPRPGTIGADRLANSVAAQAMYQSPAIVVDFGTAVTFDVINADGAYAGGVIAPGLRAMTDYLHERTALLPRVTLREPERAIGRSTREAMQSGAVYGYRGLIAEILSQLRREMGAPNPIIIATGGDATLIAGKTALFHNVAPLLTLEGLRLIGSRHFAAHGS